MSRLRHITSSHDNIKNKLKSCELWNIQFSRHFDLWHNMINVFNIHKYIDFDINIAKIINTKKIEIRILFVWISYFI